MIPKCVILGGGGHARVLIDALLQSGQVELLGVLVPDASRWGTQILGVPVLGGDDLLPRLAQADLTHFVVGLGSVGNSLFRQHLFQYGLAQGLQVLSVRHPSAMVSSHAVLGRGSQFLPGCIVNAGAVIGENVIINSGAIVEHDCRISAHVHVATGACLSGTVHVEEGAHIGVGAVVRQGIQIGPQAIIGAGAVVVRDVPAGTTVVGNPARAQHKTNTEEN